MERLTIERVENELLDFIRSCDGDSLADLYEICFARVTNALYVEGADGQEAIEVEWKDD